MGRTYVTRFDLRADILADFVGAILRGWWPVQEVVGLRGDVRLVRFFGQLSNRIFRG